MSELLSKHTIKIQLVAAVSVILAVITWTAYGVRYMAKVDASVKTLEEIQPEIRKVPILENNIQYMKNDIGEIKQDIKTLLRK